jgi:hypothetical protein
MIWNFAILTIGDTGMRIHEVKSRPEGSSLAFSNGMLGKCFALTSSGKRGAIL